MNPFSIAIHGGAGTLVKGMMTAEKELAYRTALKSALVAGYALLENGGSAVDAVAKAVQILEDSPLFNAGKGSVFTATGNHEMDASSSSYPSKVLIRSIICFLITPFKQPSDNGGVLITLSFSKKIFAFSASIRFLSVFKSKQLCSLFSLA